MSSFFSWIIEVLVSNLALIALVISSLSLFLYFKDYRWKTKPKLEMKMKDLNFDMNVNSHREGEFFIRNKYRNSAGSEGFIRNKGGIKTTIEVLKIKKYKRLRFLHKWLNKKEVVLLERGKAFGYFILGSAQAIPHMIEIESGQSIFLAKLATKEFLRTLYHSNSPFRDDIKREEHYFLVADHVFGEALSNPFKISLSEKTIHYLKLNFDEDAFCKLYRTR